MNSTSASYRAGSRPASGQKFTQLLADQTPVYDGRRRHNKAARKHRGNLRREPNFIK